jgi:hypothetical protein
VDTGIVILQYAVYLLEAGLLAYVLVRRRCLRLLAVTVYLGLLLAVDGVSRPYILYRFGFESRQYAYFFWLTDVLLILGAFLLIGFFFRRACAEQPKMWQHVRLLLAFVLVLVAGASLLAISRNYNQLFSRFIIEFQQNLYFTCLVLNTLLFLLIHHLEIADEELTLLVCGMGIQFAGPAANFALVYLTRGYGFSTPLYTYLGPLCTLGMLLTWFHAVARSTSPALVPNGERQAGALAAIISRQA